MNVDEARQLLKETMEAKFKDKTFRHYINESLAGDFAVEVATVLQQNCCQITALKQVVAERDEKIKERCELERSYNHQLGELARLSDTVCSFLLSHGNLYEEAPQVKAAAEEIMEYVEAVRPPEGAKAPEWFAHIIGPDDLHACRGEFDALRMANQHNRSWARLMADDPKPNDPYCVAVAVTKEMLKESF